MWPRAPFLKGKGYLPNPIVKYGIPKYADSVANKKVIGTPDHQKYWEEQIYYIMNGYPAGGGITIPGLLYWFLNFRKLPTVRGPIYPEYCDLHLELANFIDYVERNRKNGLIPKARRKGISEFFSAKIDHGYRFKIGYKAGVAAGLDDYAQDFMSKWYYADSLIVPELRVLKLTNNPGEIIAGYEEKIDNAFDECGTRNTIYTRTMFNNAQLFKGLYLNDVYLEELGEWKNGKVKEFVSATEPCTMFGSVKYGNIWGAGTGGADPREFRELYEKAEHYKFEVFFIDGRRFYFPFYGFKGAKKTEEDGDVVSKTPNLLDLKPYEREGVEDLKAAEDFIKSELDRLSKADNKKDYFEYKQNYPLKINDVFAKSIINDFDAEKLNAQSAAIAALDHPRYNKYRLKWVTDDNGMKKMPLRVEIEPLKMHEDEAECVYMLNDVIGLLSKVKQYRNLFVAGNDSYDQDTSKTSKSLGAMCVLIRLNTISPLQKCPVAVIRTRPRRKELYYDLSLKLAVLFNLQGNVLVDVRTPAIIQYFKDQGGEQFLAMRPAKFESPNSEQGHDYGVSLNQYSRPLMVSVMQTAIYDHSEHIWFNSDLDVGPNLITELQNYDGMAVGSDNDLADAYGIALMQDISCEIKPKDMSQDNRDDRFEMPEFGYNVDGELIMLDNSERLRPDNPYGSEDEFDDGRLR